MEDKKDGTSEEINLERDENILKVIFNNKIYIFNDEFAEYFFINLLTTAGEISCPKSCKLTHRLPETVPFSSHD